MLSALQASAAASFDVQQIGRNVTRGDVIFGTDITANAGTETVLIDIEVSNIGANPSTTSTTVSATLPSGASYVSGSAKLFGGSCADTTNGCPISDSVSGAAFPLDDPYILGALAVNDGISVQYRLTITPGTTNVMTLPAVTVADGAIQAQSGTMSLSPDLPPVITLTGSSTIQLVISEAFTDPGATATDVNEGTLSVVRTGTVNTGAVGTYALDYNVSDSRGNAATQKTRIVQVSLDTVKPVITMNGSSTVTLVLGASYTDAGATATDNIQGTITNQIVTTNPVNSNVLGTYTVRYNVTDSSGLVADEKTRTVQIIATPDTTKPIIALLGSATVTLTVGDTYTDAGATATDDIDGTITSNITSVSTVNTAVAGTYSVTYNVSDSSGNAADSVIRTIVVNTPPVTSTPVVVIVVGSGGGGGGGGGSSAPEVPNSSVVINADTALTNSRTVTLTLKAISATQMMIADDASFTGREWEVFATTKIWTLPSGVGTKTVYAKFRDIGMNVAGPVSDSIYLQEGAVVTPVIAGTTSGTDAQYVFTRDLAYEDAGQDVTELQKIITSEGFYEGAPSGTFDTKTLEAVKKYQKAKGITATGYIGPLTKAELNKKKTVGTTAVSSIVATSGTYTRDLAYGKRGADVTNLQSQLTKEGFYNGPVTGYYGALTVQAVKKYQVAKKISPAAGYVGPLTRVALGASLPQNVATPITPVAPTTPVAPSLNVAKKEEAEKNLKNLQAQLLELLEQLKKKLE